MPMASAPNALPCAMSLRNRLVPSCAAEFFTQPRASSTVTTSGFSFFSTPLARATSRILRATSRVRSAMERFLHETNVIRGGGAARQAHRQHARDVDRAALGAILDLVPARGAVGHDQRFGI